jgi:hypothetical protein
LRGHIGPGFRRTTNTIGNMAQMVVERRLRKFA